MVVTLSIPVYVRPRNALTIRVKVLRLGINTRQIYILTFRSKMSFNFKWVASQRKHKLQFSLANSYYRLIMS